MKKTVEQLREQLFNCRGHFGAHLTSEMWNGMWGVMWELLNELESLRGCEEHEDCRANRRLAVACQLAKEEAEGKRCA